ncbi:MAG: hypothetical protein WA126_16275 [Thermodesulfovibrionales bacterium]
MKQFEDDKRSQTSDNLNQNYYLRLDKSITPLISYQLYLRTNLTNSHTTDSQDKTTKTYQRAIEPALDLSFRNPIYGLDVGTRRLEQWSTANLSDDSRKTTEFYYARLNVRPYDLPSLSLQFDRQKDYDHLSERKIDTTNNRFSGSSWYDVLYKDIKISYNLTYTRNESKTPIGTISKTINNSLNALYSLGYNKSFWSGRANVSAGYQGNYVRNKNDQYATQTGNVPFERTPSSGRYGLGTQLQPDVDTLIPANALIDNIYNVPVTTAAGTINIGQNGNKFHNIGIQLFSTTKPVDTLFIYVNKDVRSDTNLINVNNWRVYLSDFNLPATWTEIPVQTVTVSAFDILNTVYRYEIRFFNPQSGSYFRVINRENASINDVLVTEIEAFGTDVIPQSGKITDVTTFFTHGINLLANLRPFNRLTFSLNYFLNKADENPDSVLGSIGSAFQSIFKKPTNEEDNKLRSNITRTYGISSTWLTHRLLTTTVRFQRNEAFDNKDETDISKTDIVSDTYSLTFNSSPLPTLNTNLSFIRTYSYSFDEKQSMNTLYFLTIGSRLYRDVNMITDIGYTRSESFPTERQISETTITEKTGTSTKYIRNTLDARLTQKLSGNLSFGLTRTSGTTSTTSKDGYFILTYRPGRFINLSGNIKVSDTDGDTNISEGMIIDWLFLPAIRMNLSYQHSKTEPGPNTVHSLSSYVMWYITKFSDLQLNYIYTRDEKEKKLKTYNIGGNLTCRFW